MVAEQFAQPPGLSEVDAAGDYVPHIPNGEDVPDAWADSVFSSFTDVSEREASQGAALGSYAIDLLTGPANDGRDCTEVVITHGFTIGWLVRHALDAPNWRSWGLNQCHAGLTVIRYRLAGPPTVVVWNDVTHLPADLRWTGFPDDCRV